MFIKIKKKNGLEWGLFTVLIACLGYSFFTMYYSDIIITCEHSINLLRCIFSGRFLEFYDYAKHHSIYGTGAFYDIWIYILFGIWNIPIYFLNAVFNISIYSLFALLWYKAFVVVVLLRCVHYMKKICAFCTTDIIKEKYIALFAMSSLLVIVPTFQVAQYDDIYILFMLIAIYYLLKEDRKRFVFYFALAIPMKSLALLFFIPLLLLVEKRVIHIMLNMCMSFILPMVSKLLFGNSVAYNEIAEFSKGYLFNCFFSTNMKIVGIEGISLFAIAYACICVYAFATKDLNNSGTECVKFSFLVSLAFFTLADTTPYWLIMMGIFMTLYVFICIDDVELGLWLECIVSGCFFLCGIYRTNWVFGGQKTFSYLFLKRWDKGLDRNVETILSGMGIARILPIVSGILLGCAIMMLTILAKRDFSESSQKQGIQPEYVLRNQLLLRILILTIWCGLETIILL